VEDVQVAQRACHPRCQPLPHRRLLLVPQLRHLPHHAQVHLGKAAQVEQQAAVRHLLQQASRGKALANRAHGRGTLADPPWWGWGGVPDTWVRVGVLPRTCTSRMRCSMVHTRHGCSRMPVQRRWLAGPAPASSCCSRPSVGNRGHTSSSASTRSNSRAAHAHAYGDPPAAGQAQRHWNGRPPTGLASCTGMGVRAATPPPPPRSPEAPMTTTLPRPR
jgi:hypothetical protein